MKKPTDILYIHHDGAISGSAISLRNLLLGLDRQRFSPRVLLTQDGPARKLYEALQIPVDIIPIREFPTCPGYKWHTLEHWKAWFCFVPNLKLNEYLRRVKPDLVHVNDKMMLGAGIAAKRVGIPIIWHSRSTYKATYSWMNRLLSQFVIRRYADHIIAISEDETEDFDDLPNLSIIYNSVDFDQVSQALTQKSSIVNEFSLQGRIVIGTVSSGINEMRGTFDFIRAVSIVKKQLPDKNFKFIIVAPIPQEPFLENYRRAVNLAHEVQIEQELVFTGFRNDVLAFMSVMNVILLCNRHRALGRMSFEAMALGRPVVVTVGHSGKSRVAIDGETALIVPPDDPKAMASAILKLLDSPDLCSQLGERGAAYTRQHFDPQRNTQLVEGIYRKLLEKANSEK